jgi:hypothetical protein
MLCCAALSHQPATERHGFKTRHTVTQFEGWPTDTPLLRCALLALLDEFRCCGDQYHFDLSNQAFGKIADLSKGVVGIYYRQVGCCRLTQGLVSFWRFWATHCTVSCAHQ